MYNNIFALTRLSFKEINAKSGQGATYTVHFQKKKTPPKP